MWKRIITFNNMENDADKRNYIRKSIVVLLMLLPGIFLDLVYHGYIECTVIRKAFHFLSGITGVTYQGALDILNGTVGVVMTMVSLFLATSINLAQRRGDHIYGIPRSELEDVQPRHYSGTRRLSYIAPLLVILFLNLSWCITGYLLYLYCYSFYFMYYHMHEQSYNENRNQSAVVKKIIREYDNNIDDRLLAVQIIFEKMRNSVSVENNWSEMGTIYKKVMGSVPRDDVNQMYGLSGEFFYILFFHESCMHELEAQKFIRDFIGDFDRKKHVKVLDAEWAKLFAILEIAIMDMSEAGLIKLLIWLQNFTYRKKVLQQWNEKNRSQCRENVAQEIDSQTIQIQRTLICILLECRFQYSSRGVNTLLTAQVAKEHWQAINTAEYFDSFKSYKDITFHHPMIYLSDIIESLKGDYENGTSVSMLVNAANNIR